MIAYWQLVERAREDIVLLAQHLPPPKLGHHRSKVETLKDGEWVIFSYNNKPEPEYYLVLKGPPT